ncbi:MAG: esterase [Rubrivivax sp.]
MNFRDSPVRRGRCALAGLVAAITMAACGGGSSQIKDFRAEEVYAFGDEASVLTADGRKYSVNALDSSGARDCAAEPIWVQRVAALYDLVFAECNPNALPATLAFMRAAPGAVAADLSGQIDVVEAAGVVPDHSLATVLMGANDIWALYAEYPARSEDELADASRDRGELIGKQVNRLVAAGVRVLVVTVPDQGLTPRALAEKAAHTDTDRARLLTRLTAALNTAIRLTIVNDGRLLGLVLGDEMVQAMVKSPRSFGLDETEEPVCTVALPDCTSATLVTDGKSNDYLWADDRQLAYGGQSRLGGLALSRALNNPF